MKKNIYSSIIIVLMLLTGMMTAACGGSAELAVSSISLTEITDSSVTITWETGRPATTHIDYGGTTNMGMSNNPDTTLKTSHSVTLSDLSSKTKYYFKITAVDASDSEVTSERLSFSTKFDAENSIAVIQTTMGTIQVELYETRAPITTTNFIRLARGNFYNGLIFHRVIDDFMIQGGDPNGDGSGGSGTNIGLEIHPDLKHVDGAISMARSQDPNSASSQFFICDGTQVYLDGGYAVFGQTIQGIEVVRAIASVTTDTNDKPFTNIVMTSVTIE